MTHMMSQSPQEYAHGMLSMHVYARPWAMYSVPWDGA
jgi:hypothetical protein